MSDEKKMIIYQVLPARLETIITTVSITVISL